MPRTIPGFAIIHFLFAMLISNAGCDKVFDPVKEAYKANELDYFPMATNANWNYVDSDGVSIEDVTITSYNANSKTYGILSTSGLIFPAGTHQIRKTVREFCNLIEMQIACTSLSEEWISILVAPATSKYWDLDPQFFQWQGCMFRGFLSRHEAEVVVPAGTFTNCIRCIQQSYVSPINTIDYYLAPGVGVIKITDGISTIELQSYSIPEG